MLKFKILDKVEADRWNELLLNSNYSTVYQSTKFLETDESRFPVFVYIIDEENRVKGQLALQTQAGKEAYELLNRAKSKNN